jgi:hypothetical protein
MVVLVAGASIVVVVTGTLFVAGVGGLAAASE